MTSSVRLAAMIACAVCVTPAYGGYEFQKITDEWMDMWAGSAPVLNNQGQILFGEAGGPRLWLHSQQGLTSIGGGPTNYIFTFDMNDAGDVVYSWGSANGEDFVTRYRAGNHQTVVSSLMPGIVDSDYVAINNSGTIAASVLVEGAHGQWLIGLYKIALDNEITPWMHPELYPFDFGVSELSLADAGDVAFRTEYGSYLSPAPNSYIPTAQWDPNGYYWPIASPINAAGQVAYLDWSDDEPSVPSLAITDGLTTQTRDLFADSEIETLAINDAGDVVYLGTHSASGTTGIFVNDSSLPVAAIGNDLNGSPVTWLTLSSRGFNDAGQIVFWADLEDGSSGLYLATPAAGLPGDFNGDGVINTEDINPFILALTGGSGGPLPDPLLADPNGDGVINTEDINVFIALLTGGGVGLTEDINPFIALPIGGGGAGTIPEPGSAAVLLLLVAAVSGRRRGWGVR